MMNPIECPLHLIMEKIAGKWKLIIIYSLNQSGVIRFSDLHRLIGGVSQKVLTSQLRELERDGLLIRKVYPEVPPKVEYSLTGKGKSLSHVLDSLADWATTNMVSELES